VTLRAQIQAAIEKNQAEPEKAAIAVCLVLEREIGLSGNGWFDDDHEMGDEIVKTPGEFWSES
jgi:hypothetical protein